MKNDNKEEKYNSNITKDDKQALRERQDVNTRTDDVDFSGKELDVPGRKLPSNTTKRNLKDEENTLYGQGSSTNENLEQDKNS